MVDKSSFFQGFYLLFNEIRLLSRSKLTLTSVFLTALAAVLGLNAIDYTGKHSLMELAKTPLTVGLGPAQYAGMAGSLLFAVLTLMLLSRDRRHKSTVILDTGRNHSQLLAFRTAAVLFYGIIAVMLGALAVYVVQVFILEIPFDPGVSLPALLAITLASIFFTVFLCSGLYLITDSLDIAFLVFCILFFIGISSPNYLFLWVQSPALVYSDFGGILPVFKLVLYNRLFWIFVSTGIFTAGLLCRRRYELGMGGSLKRNAKYVMVPALFLLLLSASLLTYLNEPYINPNDSVFDTELKVDEKVKLIRVFPDVLFFPEDERLSARVLYEFEKEPGTEYIDFITNPGLHINAVAVNGTGEKIAGMGSLPASFAKIKGTDRIRVEVPAKARNVMIDMSYAGKIKYSSPVSFRGYISEESIYLLEESHWIFEPLTASKGMIEIVGSVTAPDDLVVVVPGNLTGVLEEQGRRTLKYSALSNSFSPGVFAGDYEVKKMQAGSTEVEFYYSPKHRAYIETLEIENHICNIVAYYEKNIGSYPYQEYPLKIVETSIYKPGGHSTLNIVTVSEYVFNREMDQEVKERSDSFSPDPTSYKGHTFILDIDLLAHEIAHQWWGTGVRVEEDSPWSSEGLVCYMAYKYVTEKFGSDISAVIPQMWRKRVNSLENSYYYTNPKMLENLPEKQRQRYELQTLKTELYGQMPLQLMRAEELLGEDLFFARLSEIYAEYRFKSLSYEEFLSSVELSEDDLEGDTRAGAEKETGGIAEMVTEKDTEGIAEGEAFLDE
ncbi:MAG: hypothetical protein C5S45_09480 [Candidatus Methanocomedens sp.]|nr:MAG: hypothetical protein C5S45_09480 [ANME-2 cluster archaeon]